MLTRRAALPPVALSLAAPALLRGALKPNVVLIVADDLGYGELGCYGGTEIPTPHLDSIAAAGIRFTSGYVSCPVCSPTRAGLMTGRYQQRFGHEFNPGPPGQEQENFGLPLAEVTVASRLKAAGYATGLFGKWHLGFKPPFHPQQRGFDEFFGFLGGAHSYLNPGAGGPNPILRGAERVSRIQYATDDFTREAVAFVERHRRRAFFLYLAYNAVHAPLEATAAYLQRFAHIADVRRRTFAAMLSALDDGVGAVLTALRRHRLEEDTLLVFLSDNGGPTRQITSSNAPLRGAKGQVYEGGIRVPFLMQWKGRLPSRKVVDHPVIALDVHPTALVAAGVPLPSGLDGVDLLAAVNSPRIPHDRLFWRFGAQSAVRMGDWKLVSLPNQPPQLFNFAAGPGETTDLAAAQPGKVRELKDAWNAWNTQLAKPLWDRPRAQTSPVARKRSPALQMLS